MKRTMLMLCHTLLMGLASVLVAQELPTIIPPSPEAASLGKFSEMPISHYTGLPNISVPITSFSVGDKSFPVSISYHGRGIQVAETASRVGLGWALNAGGQISRQVRQKPDDGMTGFFGHYSTVFNNTFKNDGTATGLDTCCAPFITDDDKLPDVFTLQAGGLSAKFIYNYKDNLNPILQKYGDLHIDAPVVNGNINGFTVTDKDGYRYYFDTTQTSDQTQEHYSYKADGSFQTNPADVDGSTANQWRLDPHTTTWHLTKIESPNGDMATFHYIKQTDHVMRRSGDTYVNSEFSCAVTRSKVDQYQLSEIRYNYDTQGDYVKIVFEANDNRQDLDNIWTSEGKELDAIKIYEKSHTYDVGGSPVTQFQLNKTFNLHHSYMVSPSDLNYHQTLASADPGAAKRLVLDSITEVGGSISKPPYKFSYNAAVLPNRHSNSQDFWGYYNGKANGQFLTYHNNDKRVDTVLSEAGMLKKITYPTGGSTRLTYEHNRGVLGAEYDGIWIPSINPTGQNSIGLSNIGINNNTYNTSGGLYGPYYNTPNFTVNSRSQFTFNINLPPWGGVNQNDACINGGSGCNFRIRLVPISNPTQPIYIWTDSFPMWIDAGDYRLEVHVPNLWNPTAQSGSGQFFNVALFWEDQVTGQGTILYAAGKRIKQVEFLDSAENVVSKKTYDYNDSGIILGLSNFTHKVPLNLGGSIVYTSADINSATPGSPFSTFQGNTIGYKIVDEYLGDKQNNAGKRRYEFLVTRDSGDFVARPVTPPTDNEWLRGLPLQIIDYKNNGNGTYMKVKQVDNEYLVTNDAHTNVLPVSNTPPYTLQVLPNNPILTPDAYTFDIASINPATHQADIYYNETRTNFRLPFAWYYNQVLIIGNPPIPQLKIFHFTGGTLDTSKTATTLFDANENPTIIDSTLTAYNYTKHYQPDMITSVTSNGEPMVRSFTYPQEIASGYTIHPNNYNTTPITALAEQHRFVPLETMTFRDTDADGVADLGEETSKSKTTFAWFPDDLTQDVLEPTLVQTGKDTDPGSVTFIDRIDFKDYDSDGNVLQVSRTDGMDITYVYGYGDTYPIAKLENVDNGNLTPAQQSAIDAAKAASENDVDTASEATLRTALDGLRTAFPDAMVTTYTYDSLIGITSMTDPKGYTVYYEYDGLNRLERVKDADGNILSENKYHYLLDN
ncbi:hypothetical protein [Winogradskyella sp.]|uniref:hypothetical protein n=1 Tax=Winogradskyella sp. TaxID=1883156 RepID=UPI003BAC9F76